MNNGVVLWQEAKPAYPEAFVVTLSNSFIVIKKDDMDEWERGGHNVFSEKSDALKYYDKCKRIM
jgi:hypothetical protein